MANKNGNNRDGCIMTNSFAEKRKYSLQFLLKLCDRVVLKLRVDTLRCC
jgi:hypothetical protein